MTDLLAPHPTEATAPIAGWPRSVVCGVDGTGSAREAVRQAVAFAGPGTKLDLHTVTRGNGFREPPAAALAEAQRVADRSGVTADVHSGPAATVAAGLLRAAAGADLLVLGCDALGGTPKAVLRHAPCSVLLARRPPDLPLLDTIMLAVESPPHVRRLVMSLAVEHGAEWRAVPAAKLPVAAAAMGCGLIVTGDGASALQLAQVAPCSVLVVHLPK